MSTSATAYKLSDRQKLILIDLIASLFCALFGAVYEAYSHGVYSYAMIYAFAYPLALGVLPMYLIGILRATYPPKTLRCAYHAGIAALTVGGIVKGALEIYGTAHPLSIVYPILGAVLCGGSAIAYLIFLLIHVRKKALAE